jgi:hypothetical protein
MFSEPLIDFLPERLFGTLAIDANDHLAWLSVAPANAENHLGITRSGLRRGDTEQFDRRVIRRDDLTGNPPGFR